MKRLWVLAALCGSVVIAQNSAGNAPEKVDPALKAEVRKLLVTMHIDQVLHQQLETSIPPMIKLMKQNPSVSPQFADEFAKQFEAQVLASHDLTDMIVDTYVNRFTISEIKDLQAFYNSSTGRKMVDVQPELMATIAKKAGTYGQTLALEVAKSIAKDHPEYLVKPADNSAAPPATSFKPPPLPEGTTWVNVDAPDEEALLIKKVEPVYPQIAKSASVQGTVLFEAYIGMDGKVQEVNLVSGHPLLIKAAMDAVKQWAYKPLILSGKPNPVLTTVALNFKLEPQD